jgi:hypothetical protein
MTSTTIPLGSVAKTMDLSVSSILGLPLSLAIHPLPLACELASERARKKELTSCSVACLSPSLRRSLASRPRL